MPVNWRQNSEILQKQKEKSSFVTSFAKASEVKKTTEHKKKQKRLFIVKTNYQVLNMFEIATVIMIAAGFVLLGTILFGSLQARTQDQVAASMQLLDASDSIAVASQTVSFATGSMREFYDEFYLAFTQVAIVAPESFEAPIKVAQNFYSGFVNFSDQVASGYQPYNQPSKIASEQAGEILGAFIDLNHELKYLIK